MRFTPNWVGCTPDIGSLVFGVIGNRILKRGRTSMTIKTCKCALWAEHKGVDCCKPCLRAYSHSPLCECRREKITVTCNVCHKTFKGYKPVGGTTIESTIGRGPRWKILGEAFSLRGHPGWAHADCILSARYIGLEEQ